MNRLTRLFPIAACLFGGALMFGCSEATAPDGPELAVARPERTITDVTTCKPQPYAAASAWIGPKGGMLKAGAHRLWVPAGALKEPVLITMEIPSGYISRAVVRPEGLAFNNNYRPHLVMSYADCVVTPGANQLIAKFSEVLGPIESTPSDTDPVSQTIDGTLSYLSDYVLLSTYAVVY